MFASSRPIRKQQVWSPGLAQRSEFTALWRLEAETTGGSRVEEDADPKETFSNLTEETLMEPGPVRDKLRAHTPLTKKERNRWANILNMLSVNASTHEVKASITANGGPLAQTPTTDTLCHQICVHHFYALVQDFFEHFKHFLSFFK